MDASEDIFLEDVGAEVDVNPDEVANVEIKKKKRKSMLLKKGEREEILKMLSGLQETGVAQAVVSAVSSEHHMRIFKDRGDLWELLKSDQLFMGLVKQLVLLFVRIYQLCQTGKDKYSRFQVEWHKQCSSLLQDQCLQKELLEIHQQWLSYCAKCEADRAVSNPIMVAVCSAVFDYLMSKINQHQKEKAKTSDPILLPEQEKGVYYRFGGAALSSMLHQRYNKLKPDMPESDRAVLKEEISILKAINCTDKDHVPEYLQYRDMGYMYFPAVRYIPFIEHVDQCVLEHTNEKSLQEHGSSLVGVVTAHLRQNKDLEKEFITLLTELYSRNTEVVQKIYLEFTRKLCNTRIQEFLDVYRQLAAKKEDGKHTLSGQNLRDKLLTYHTSSKSQ